MRKSNIFTLITYHFHIVVVSDVFQFPRHMINNNKRKNNHFIANIYNNFSNNIQLSSFFHTLHIHTCNDVYYEIMPSLY